MRKEYSTFRKEIKYKIPLSKALRVRNYLDRLLQKDSHGEDGAYSVRSLYFDSINNEDFFEKLSGIEKRKKVRLRIYNNDESLCKLELKQKIGDYQYKQSIVLPKADAEEIVVGNFSKLKKYFHGSEAGLKIYKIMEMGRYRPVVLIEYDRIAYKHPMYDTRITLDMNIRATESNLDIFSQKVVYTPIEYENVILEVKYNEKLMGYISDMLAQFELTQNSYSKYCAGREIYYNFDY